MESNDFLIELSRLINQPITWVDGLFKWGNSFGEIRLVQTDQSYYVEVDSHTKSLESYYFAFDSKELPNQKSFRLELYEDLLNKVSAIVLGLDFPEGITVTIDLPENEMMFLKQLAHDNNLTVDKMVEQLLIKHMGN